MNHTLKKPPGPVIIALILAVIVLIAPGCTGAPDSFPAAPADPAPASPALPAVVQKEAVTPAPTTPGCAYPPLNPWTLVPESYRTPSATMLPPATGTQVSKADLFGTPSLRWQEYEYVQQIANLPDSYGTARTEKDREYYRGEEAVHENLTYGLHPPGAQIGTGDYTIDDSYYDGYGNMLSMHRRAIRDNDLLENRDYPPVDTGRGTPDCSGEVYSPRYTFTGTDPVTEPAGSFSDALKYTRKNFHDSAYSEEAVLTYWFSPAAPVPVKWMLDDPEKGLLFIYELKGWG